MPRYRCDYWQREVSDDGDKFFHIHSDGSKHRAWLEIFEIGTVLCGQPLFHVIRGMLFCLKCGLFFVQKEDRMENVSAPEVGRCH